MQRRIIWKTCNFTRFHCQLDQKACFESERTLTLVGDADDPLYADRLPLLFMFACAHSFSLLKSSHVNSNFQVKFVYIVGISFVNYLA
ncbi:unnamed protein product [Prunus brigantina]